VWPRVALTVFLWLAFVRPTLPAADPTLDPSWSAVQAFILRGGAQCGVDTVFTFGPFGWFNKPTYVAELFIAGLWWEIAFKLLAAAVVVAVLGRLDNVRDFALACFAAACAGSGPDGFAFVVLFADAAWIADRPARPAWQSILAAAPSVALALVKFPYFLAFVAATLALAVLAWPHGRRRALAFVAGVALLFVAAWSASGQSASNLPAWIATSLALARGYGAALGTETSVLQFALALLVLAACAVALRLALAGERARGSTVWVGLFAFTAWLAFKNGFVRGQDKPLAVFDFAAVGMFVLPIAGLATSRAARILRRAACVAALAGHALVLSESFAAPRALFQDLAERIGAGTVFLARPLVARANLEDDLAAKRVEYGLPRVRERVGHDTIDVFGSAQGVAFLNGLEYRPRPVFQGYAAYTPELQDLNRRFFESARAPQWVLFAFSALDDHLPAIEDTAAFAVISRRYRLELEERGYLLLKRIDPTPPPSDVGSLVVSRTARCGERLDFASLMPEGSGTPRVLTLAFELRPSFLGSLGAALLKSPPLWIEVEDARGRRHTWRIVPGSVAGGFVISPLLETPEHCKSWFHGDMELGVRGVRVLAAEGDRWAFDDEFRFELRRADSLAPLADEGYEQRRLAAILRPAPDAIETSAGFEIVMLRAETEVLVVGTPASVRFDLGAGRWKLSAHCGLHPRLADPAANGAAIFRVVVRDAQGTETEIDRRRIEQDRGPRVMRLQSEFELASGGALFLRTERADPGGKEAVNAHWTLVTIEPRR
jgi:hypothetical protein